MSFHVLLQYTPSENNRVTKEITTVQDLTGNLRNESSVLTPVIRIDITGMDTDNLFTCNYMTINKFNRKYFITDIRVIRTNIIEVSGRVDVLSTYDATLRQLGAIVTKQENNWNLYLDDGTFKVYNNPLVITKSFPSGFSSQSFLMAIAGK